MHVCAKHIFESEVFIDNDNKTNYPHKVENTA